MLVFGIIAAILILAPDLVCKYTNNSDKHGGGGMWSEDDGEPSKIILWIFRVIGVVIFAIGLYYEFT